MKENYRNIIVVGSSAGGVEALINMLRPLSAELSAAIFVVQHIPNHTESNLHRVLANHTTLTVKRAEDGENIQPATVYVACADHHLLVENDRLVVSKGPKENRFRPAVDTLFRSAANNYGRRVVGVVLSGALNDGTSGMWTINRLGGTTIVQQPDEAMFPDMPEGVMKYTKVDHVMAATEIGKLLNELVMQPIELRKPAHGVKDTELLDIEVAIAKGENGLEMGILEHGERSPLACPECHGALTQFEEGKLIRFRCHTGHAHTAESLLASINENIEKSMWEVMRGMEESTILLKRMAGQLERTGSGEDSSALLRRAEGIATRSKTVQEAILSSNRVTASRM